MEGKRKTSFTVELVWNEVRLIAAALRYHDDHEYIPAADELADEFEALLESDSE